MTSRTRKQALALLAALAALAPCQARGQAGVLFEEGSSPNPAVLSLADMDVRVTIDDLHANVEIVQVFENRTARQLRGRYELALGQGAAVSGFAIWEGTDRREAVVVERAQGERIFEDLTARSLDPGLLETSDDRPSASVYAVRVDPIPPFTRFRIEVSYSQDLEVAGDEALFVFPLAGRELHRQTAEHVAVDLEVDGAWPLAGAELRPEALRLESPLRPGATAFRARLEGRDVDLDEDLVASLRLGRDRAAPLRPHLLAYRRPLGKAGRVDRSAFGAGRIYTDDRGTFVLRTPAQFSDPEAERSRRDLVVAVDTSLSMGAGKLERAAAAVEAVLADLGSEDRFALMTFNDEIQVMAGGVGPASPARVAEARRFFRSGYLAGGTDLREAGRRALALLEGSTAPRRAVVLVTDGQPTMGSVRSATVGEAVAEANGGLAASRGRLFVLGVGDSANHLLLRRLAEESEGLYAHVGEGADIEPVLRTFLYRLGAESLEDVEALFDPAAGVEDLYSAGGERVFDGSAHAVYGRYRSPSKRTVVRVTGQLQSRSLAASLTTVLPERDERRPWIARGWAQLRVEDLLGRIDREGERPEWVREIVALAREHLLVTPYTSLIAAARSLLRPREIMPGDPVLRVRVDPSDRAVTAVFPFGLVKRLRRVEPGLFETRFLAPVGLEDGRHEVDLVVTGADGRLRRLRDHFVIDSTAPSPVIEPLEGPLSPGARVTLRVRSDQDTRRLTAHLGEALPVELRWSDDELACVGELVVDPDLPTGEHSLVVVAEDHAHNVGSAVARVEVLGR